MYNVHGDEDGDDDVGVARFIIMISMFLWLDGSVWLYRWFCFLVS